MSAVGADLGYESMQFVHNAAMSGAEVVATSRACMAPAQPSGSPAADARLAMPALRACTKLLDVRTWAGIREAGSCLCNDSSTARAPRQTRATQVNPTALAAVVRELRKERDALAAASSQAEAGPRR